MGNLSRKVKFLHLSNIFTTGASTAVGLAVDMSGFEGCIFLADFGITTTARNLQVSGSTASGGTYTTLAGCVAATTVTNRLVFVDVYRPTFRFLKHSVSAANTTETGGGVVAIQYGPRVLPTTSASTDVAASAFVAGATT